MKFKIKDPMLVMARIKGKTNRVREVTAILDFNNSMSWMIRLDAIHLGYSEAANRPEDYKTIADANVPEVLTIRSLELGIALNLAEVSIGDLSAKNVRAFILPVDIPRLIPVDLVLGRSFLNNFKMVFDPKAGYLTLT